MRSALEPEPNPLTKFLSHLYLVFAHLGGLGLLTLGILDSSFLFVPLGNDVLVIAMSAKRHVLAPYYALMATIGSVLGCAAIDILCRKEGEKGLEKYLSRKRLENVRRRMKKNAAWTLAVASLMPPPFPFTPFVAAASAVRYPRRKLLGVIACARFVRFSIEGLLAILVGNELLRLARSRGFEYAIGGLIFISILGSIFSVYHWIASAKGRSSGGRKRAKAR
ncbi:MAG: VTT domain-containing protein [Terriglobia bacterium]